MTTSLSLRRSNVVWFIFNVFIVLYPLSEVIRQQTSLPGAIVNVVFLVAMAAVLCIHLIQARHRSLAPANWTAAEWCLILFLGLTILATVHSIVPGRSLIGLPDEYQGLLPWLAYGILFFWVRRRVHPGQHTRLLTTLAISSIFPAIYGILQHSHWIPGIAFQSRITSYFLNADFCGTYFALMFFVTLTLCLNARSRAATIVYLAISILNFMALIFSYTRSAWLGTVVALLMFIIVALRINRRLWKRFLIAFVLLLGAFGILNAKSHHQVTSRASTIASNVRQLVTRQDVNSVGSDRWYIWVESLPTIQQHPFLGTGPDTFLTAFHPPLVGLKQYLNNEPMENANNNYIQIAVSQGIPALITFVGFLGLAIRQMFSMTPRPEASTSNPLLHAGLSCAVAGYLIQAVFNIDVVTVAPFFWIIAAMATT